MADDSTMSSEAKEPRADIQIQALASQIQILALNAGALDRAGWRRLQAIARLVDLLVSDYEVPQLQIRSCPPHCVTPAGGCKDRCS